MTTATNIGYQFIWSGTQCLEVFGEWYYGKEFIGIYGI